MTNPAQYSNVYKRLLANVAMDNPDEVDKFKDDFKAWNGDPNLLELFTQLMGVTSIYRALENANFRSPGIRSRESFEELIREIPDEGLRSKLEVSVEKELSPTGRKYVGRAMTQKMVNPMMLITRNDGLPGIWIAGPRATTHILEFDREADYVASTPEKRREAQKRRTQNIDD